MARMTIDHIPDEWVEEADQRGISLREYGRRMVRAGRRQFGHDYEPSETPATPQTLKLEESTGSEVEAHLKAWIQKNLSTDDAQGVDELVALLEDELATLADELCDEEKAKYRRSRGGYLKVPSDE